MFRDDAERERFVERLGERVANYRIRLYAYCLMLTHVHLYLETPGANLGRFMHSLNTAFTVYSNLRRNRHGPLVGRYKAKPVEGDRYHRTLSRYIHLNPVRTQVARALPVAERLLRLRAYCWSSCPAYLGDVATPEWLSCAPVLALCGRPEGEQRREYRRYMEAGVSQDDEETALLLKASPLAMGDDAFIGWVRERLLARGGLRKRAEDARLRVAERSLPAADVLRAAAAALGVQCGALQRRRRNSDLRGVAARLLCRHAGLTQRDAAAALRMGTGGAVAHLWLRLETRLRSDAALRHLVTTIDSALEQKRLSLS